MFFMPSVNISEFTAQPARPAGCLLMCAVLGRSWPDELCASQGAYAAEPLLEGSGPTCRIPIALFRHPRGAVMPTANCGDSKIVRGGNLGRIYIYINRSHGLDPSRSEFRQ